jgi:CubicO group peptidase (beta-lactamase class C family)
MSLLADAIDLLSAWIDSQMAYAGQPGLSIGIVHDQQLVWAAGFGHTTLGGTQAATPDTLYRIASITKLFTSTALLQLRDAGRLQLDDPIVKHLPWFSIGLPDGDAAPITIRHLITHTAGLPREAAFPYWTDGDFPTIDKVRERLPQQRAALPVEREWKYSNLGLALAGEVVAAAAGRPYAEYVTHHVLEPLGMKRTFVSTPPPDHPDLAAGYERRLPAGRRAAAPHTDGRGITAAAGMTTCVTDLARFAMFQFRDGTADGVRILKPSTLREMQRPHWVEPDWAAGWGLGFRILRRNGKTYIGHGGALRGYRTQLQLCPAERLGVIVLTNADDGDPVKYVDKAFDWVGPAILKAAAPTAAAAPAGWERYAGRYRSAWGDAQVMLVEGRLAMLDPSMADPMPHVIWLNPMGEHTFCAETRNGFASHGEPVVFELDGGGHVVRVKVGDNYLTAIPRW